MARVVTETTSAFDLVPRLSVLSHTISGLPEQYLPGPSAAVAAQNSLTSDVSGEVLQLFSRFRLSRILPMLYSRNIEVGFLSFTRCEATGDWHQWRLSQGRGMALLSDD
jgi:hypothetical protein